MKTKIQVVSDLHLEFSPHWRPAIVGADVLILSGDICVADYFTRNAPSPYYALAQRFREFFQYCSENWKKVYYVLGNHEHYHGVFENTYNILYEVIKPFGNIALLENEAYVCDDYVIFGGTLWTDCNGGNPITQLHIKHGMNDYRLIKTEFNSPYPMPLRVENTIDEHRKTLAALHVLMCSLENTDEKPVIVCTHHAPSYESVSPYFRERGGPEMNFGYFSDLEEMILSYPKIKLWTHGHMHSNSDYMIGGTRVYCNPRGYNDENPNFREEFITVE